VPNDERVAFDEPRSFADEELRIWDANTRELIVTLPMVGIFDLAFDADGNCQVACGVWEPVKKRFTSLEVRVLDATTGQEIRSISRPGSCTSVALDPNNQRAAVAIEGSSINVWDMATGQESPIILSCPQRVFNMKFSRDGRRLGSVCEDGTVDVWETTTRQSVCSFKVRLDHPYSGAILQIAFSPDGNRLVGMGLNLNVTMWDMSTGQEVLSSYAGPEGGIFSGIALSPCVDFSSDGKRLVAAGGGDSIVRTWTLHEPGPENQVVWRRALETRSLAWHLQEGMDAVRARLPFTAEFHLKWLSTTEPEDGTFYARRGSIYAGLGQWKQAADDFGKATGRIGDDPTIGYKHALLCLWLGDTKGYCAACASSLERIGRMRNPSAANNAAWICALAPDKITDVDRRRALVLAQRLHAENPQDHNLLNTLGALLYRVGEYQAAVEKLSQAVQARNQTGSVTDWLFLAMANHRLGQTNLAKTWLAKAVQFIEQVEQQPTIPGPGWAPWLEIQILRREAEALVKGWADAKE
jgi:Flp pilus assembly protein TadD